MLKKSEFVQKKKSRKETFERSAKINGKDKAIIVGVALNENKGLYTITQTITSGMITGNSAEDKALIKVIGDLTENAVEFGKEWQADWNGNQKPKDDPNQRAIDD